MKVASDEGVSKFIEVTTLRTGFQSSLQRPGVGDFLLGEFQYDMEAESSAWQRRTS